MFTAYDELKNVINITKITKITLDEIELEKEATFKLMKEIETEDIFDGIVFWTKDSRIDKVKEYDYYGDEETYFEETKLKQKTNVKVIPESLVQLWKDPETKMHLPLKTKAYLKEENKRAEMLKKEIEENNKRNYERTKNLIETQLKATEKFKFESFTIIKGGDFDRCRYITLPKTFPIPKYSHDLYFDKFYENMTQAKKYVDFIGLAGMKNNKPCILFGYSADSLKNAKDLRDLVNKAIKENKFTPVLGISQEAIGGQDLDRVMQEIKKELENELNKQ